ncbi:S8 family serine peptidase [Amycolatopsis acidiphila]|uniref:S8 family serine peptidase n=1 Tax=Amycolatopsis acidiphila TaxID=715473 RepID=A0A557ZSY3_9PSEU|nr:S8 family serine peptidase [Amycolatopsis acidiphila]TVT15125.1 S8 family serine peptidase [Amycolatopsis acidiphila]UIJ61442.1 S8 family serine peptidase [Amycolatopsis acidiphila]GHG77660.1 peptidase S8 [Amycolatopsis acidiphila]
MRTWARRSSAAVFAIALTAAVVGTANAAPTDQPAAGLPTAKVDAATLQGKLSPRLGAAWGQTTAFIELAQQPAVDAFNAERAKGTGPDKAKQAANAAKAGVTGAVDSVLGQLRSLDAGTKKLFQTSNAVSGVVVTADAARLREIARRPDVVSIRTVVPKTRQNNSAAQLTNTLTAWQQTGRYGDGVRVGVIDDGIDYTHADFGGPGTKAAYDSVDRSKPSPLFPNAKVVGGTDLVGDDYDSNGTSGSPEPAPDPNPLACGEHGTHVAGTIGGFGLNADGTTFAGDYSKLTPGSLNAMKIGPGTAPKSLLYAIKVFGCAGSTSVTAQALDWALDPDGDGDFTDHLDIVNLSLGSDFGAPDDPDSLFVRKLAANDVLPVISAGNGGDLFDVAGSPGNTPEALTVASTRDASVLRDAAEVTAPATAAGQQGGQYSQNYTGYDTLDATKAVVKLSGANADGCAAYSAADKAAVAGKYAWLEWDDNDATRACGSAARANNAQAAGAKGVLLSSAVEHFAAGIAGNAAVPMFQFTASATAAVRPALGTGTLTVRLYGAGRTSLQTYDQSIVDSPSSFTSRGVRGPAVKPDVAAPGDTISSAFRGSGNDRAVLSGTSMAAPHTTGITALVRQAHPDWTVEEVKAAVMNTAGHDVTAGGKTYAPQRVGAGRIDAKAALDTSVLAYVQDDPGTVSVGFGTVEAGKPVSTTKTIKVVNKGTKPVDYHVEYQAVDQLPGVRYQVSTSSVRLLPHGIAMVRVTLKITDPAALRKVLDPTVEATQAGLARQFLADASGRVVFTPRAGAVPLRVPVYAAPKPVSAITVPNSLNFREGGQAALGLSGRGLDQGSGSQRYQSLISVLELQASSPKLPPCRGKITEGCTVNDTAKGGDLRYVGAASTAPAARQAGTPQDALLAFGISTWGDWANLGSNTIPFVDIDTTGDGKPDFESYVTKATGTDVLLVNTVNLNVAGEPTVDVQAVNGQLGDVDTNVFDTDVVVLPVGIAALGIDPAAASHRLGYTVGVAGYYPAPGSPNSIIDAVSTPLSFDPLSPGYSVQGTGGPALVYAAKPGTRLVVTRNAAAADADTGDDLLALAHHNGAGSRAQVIKLR